MLYIILSYLPSLLCGIHAVRSGRGMMWLWILVIAPLIGPLIYLFAVLLPEWTGGPTARKMGRAAVKALDPEREYRAAKQAVEDTPSVHNQVRVGHAAFALGRYEEAETRYREATSGSHADDADLIVHHARTLVELSRHEEALQRLESLRAINPKLIERPDVALLFARTFDGLGRPEEADAPYRWSADRLPGLEAAGRYAAFLARTGKRDDARLALEEIDRRVAKIAPPLRAEARKWRDMAAEAIAAR